VDKFKKQKGLLTEGVDVTSLPSQPDTAVFIPASSAVIQIGLTGSQSDVSLFKPNL